MGSAGPGDTGLRGVSPSNATDRPEEHGYRHRALSTASTADGIDGFRRFADGFVPGVLDALEIDRADVVATSMGGLIAIRSAIAHPERIRR